MATKTLFREVDKQEMLQRIHRLKPDSRARWGRMNAAQAFAHCQVGLRVALGDVKLKRVLIGRLFGGFAKKHVMSAKPLKTNLPTGREFVVADARDFARERDGLVELIERLAAGGPAGLTKDAHPFFGPLTTGEWEVLMWKHLDHHVRQFESA